jgi:2-dehydro-3-deoxy-D-arabinonate dehydratase
MKRGLAELAEYCVRDNPVPAGSVLLTGTGLVPEDDFTLEPGMVVEVGIAGIGRLVNTVAIASDLL